MDQIAGEGSIASASLSPPAHRYPLRFTGSGSEYFRIWIVNMLLTVVTLGVYSAWAKVRKLRYFYSNTYLDGVAFDFHGRPLAILLGRVVAVVLFVGYNYAFEFSPVAGLLAVALAVALAPLLVQRAFVFKHFNSSYRGLRFGFNGSPRDAYVALAPAVLLVTLPAAVAAVLRLTDVNASWPLLLASIALLLFYPLLHLRFKRFHHGHARYAGLQGHLTAEWDDFYLLYLPLVVIFIGWILLLIFAVFVAFQVVGAPGREPGWTQLVATYAVAVLGYGLLLATVAPFMVTRLQNLIWRKSELGEIRFDSQLEIGPVTRLYVRNALLIALTLGLYWPWAAIAVARLRLEAAAVEAPMPLDELIGSFDEHAASATGDAVADIFGFEIGL